MPKTHDESTAAAVAQQVRDAERYRWLKSRATQKTAYDLFGDGGHWSVSFYSDDQRLTFDEVVDAAKHT